MRFNIEAECYTDATFYADKIVNLVSQSCTVPSHNTAAAAAGTMSDHSKCSISEATVQAVYDLGKCGMLCPIQTENLVWMGIRGLKSIHLLSQKFKLLSCHRKLLPAE